MITAQEATPIVTRRAIYAAWRKRRQAMANSIDCGQPMMIPDAELRHFAAVAPRGTRWSYAMPGVDDGDAASYEDAVRALDGIAGRVGCIRSFVYADIPGVERVYARTHGL